MFKVIQNLLFIKQKASQYLKDDHVKASQTSALKVSLPTAVLVSFNVFLITNFTSTFNRVCTSAFEWHGTKNNLKACRCNQQEILQPALEYLTSNLLLHALEVQHNTAER